MKNSFSKVQYLLFALFLFALTGCGANSTQTTAGTGSNLSLGKITANLVLPKSAGKTVALSTAVTTIRLKVTGATIPTAQKDFGPSDVMSLEVYPGSSLIVTAYAYDTNNVLIYEGFVTNQIIAPSTNSNVTIPMNVPIVKVADAPCLTCHDSTSDTDGQNLVANYKQSGHYTNTSLMSPKNGSTQPGCAGCHGTSHNDLNPAASGRCAECHTSINMNHGTFTASGVNTASGAYTGTANNTCGTCHVTHNVKGGGCVDCHSVSQNTANGINVNDNNGVRAITGEFSKWSHHVTGVNLNDAHCAACHLEGTVANGSIVIDTTKHVADAKIHLRDTTGDNDSDFAWDPAAPNHSGMDTFCMSCHDADGATSPMSAQIQALINAPGKYNTGKTASALNPFGDTISNQYDKMQRPAVVNASSQFNTSNNSHHAVKGQRYTGRSRKSNGGTIVDATFTANSSANLPGARTTIYDAGKFNSNYTTLANSGGETSPRNGGTKLGDDSTLHCGDCHTVGQWKAGSSYTASGAPTPVAIGAHGSNNEYLLRNSIGTDARHQGIQMDSGKVYPDGVTPYLICYSCHNINNYGLASHVGEQVVGENNCNTPTNTNSTNQIGTNRLNSQNTLTYGTNVFGTFDGAVASNIYGIQCANCHNSGISAGNIFGGIHGSADPTYTDGAGNTTKHERFLPGLGNVMYAPGTRGGFVGGTTLFQSYSSKVNTSGISKGLRFKGTYAYTTGGVTNDANWEEKARIPVGDGVTVWSHNPGAAGCYTISAGDPEVYNAEGNGVPGGPAASTGLTAPDGTTLLYGNWGGCADHSQQSGASVRQPRSGNTSIRPVSY